MHSDTFYRLALSRVHKVGPVLTRLLMDHFGSAEAVFQATPKELRAISGIADKTIGELKMPQAQVEADRIIRFAERNGIRIHHYLDEDYPTRCKNHHAAPAILYSTGTVDLNHQRTVAVVGTRKPSARGIRQTERLLSSLRDFQPMIISGLAYGIDICAHREALKIGLPTTGVLGSGLDKVYPAAHRLTAKQMQEHGGLISTYPHWMGPERDHFPARNRIVAMLSDIVIVIESAERGGSIITANMTRELKKPIGAFPGRYDDKSSAGCNLLIKADGAHLVESGDDIARILGWHRSELHNQQGTLFNTLDAKEQAVVAELSKQSATSVDELNRALQWTTAQLAGKLLEMELKGLVKTVPGHRYRLAQ